ncbi:competence/damage-inducible protein A [Orrella marina]|uniref:Competence/damage-inducible protein A n=1 Tax=Orrella marina TaxID=2163011 RepID=A0A2R4XK28_9BURK|nr:molybdopterin-binding protein [Orrella marina]AWB34192.1 competence/damage-inducible protein A [Orrella marina]
MSESPQASRRIGVIIVGDEILSGRRQDKHLGKVIEMLSSRGLSLAWARILSDDRALLTKAYQESFESGDIVFSCGGIGATTDDHTRQAVAAALGVDLVLHPEAEFEIAQRCAEMASKGQGTADMSAPENQRRLQMGTFPAGSQIVPNPYNRIPGFFIHDHTFVPGFPVMAWPMLEWTLDHRYAHLHQTVRTEELSFVAYNIPESRIAPSLEEIEQRWQDVKAFSLPSVGEGARAAHIELGVKGPLDSAKPAIAFLREEALNLGATLEPTLARSSTRIE